MPGPGVACTIMPRERITLLKTATCYFVLPLSATLVNGDLGLLEVSRERTDLIRLEHHTR
jgi:hypothetical protein